MLSTDAITALMAGGISSRPAKSVSVSFRDKFGRHGSSAVQLVHVLHHELCIQQTDAATSSFQHSADTGLPEEMAVIRAAIKRGYVAVALAVVQQRLKRAMLLQTQGCQRRPSSS